MALTNEQIGLAIKIDDYVTQLYANGGTDEDWTYAQRQPNLA